MKLLFLFLLLTLFTACEDFRYKGGDDGSISGTVTLILNHLTINSAVAQTPAETQEELSLSLQANDFFTIYSDTSYNNIVTSALADAQYYKTELTGLMTSNAADYADTDFPDGMVIAMGFNEQKAIISLTLAPVSAGGSYNLKDSSYESISYYKLAFILNNAGVPKYRQSYIFRNGGKMRSDVNYASSVASVKLSEEIGKNPGLSIASLKTKKETLIEEVAANMPTEIELSVRDLYVAYYYSNIDTIDPIQQFLLQSAILHAMRSDSAFKTAMLDLKGPFETYLTTVRPGSSIYEILGSFCLGGGVQKELLYNKISALVQKQIDLGLIPGTLIIL